MYAAYVFSAVLGGGLMVISLFAGDADADLDMEADLDLDTGAGSGGPSAMKLLSLRTLVYTLFGFGATGWLLSFMGFAPAALPTLSYAAAGGLVSGALVQRAFGFLRRTESGFTEEDSSFIGLSASVTLPLGGGSAGNVSVERGDRRYTLRALPHPSAPAGSEPEAWRSVVVVDMTDGVAYVVPTDEDLSALP